MTAIAPLEETVTLARTPLFDAHRTAGARLVPFAGWEMPVQYQGVLAEVKAVRTSVGLFDVSHMGRVRVHGADALTYLQYLTVNDVARLPENGGVAQYSLLCREAGGVIDDIIVYRLGQNEFIVVVNASNREKDLSWMRGHAAAFSDVVLDDETDRTCLIAAQGPRAVEMVSALSDRDLTVMPRFGLDETVVANIPVMAARTGYTGEDGLELFCRNADSEALWAALVQAGAVPCGLGARDTLRLEAALPLYGHEMDETVPPFEARLGWVVRLDKEGDFLGKNSLRALKSGNKRQILVGIIMEGRAIPREGYAVMAGNGGPEAIGHVTSGTFSPTLGKGIALARIAAGYANRDSIIDVVVRDARHPARITSLPFVKHG